MNTKMIKMESTKEKMKNGIKLMGISIKDGISQTIKSKSIHATALAVAAVNTIASEGDVKVGIKAGLEVYAGMAAAITICEVIENTRSGN